MHLKAVLKMITRELAARQIDFILMGGLSLSTMGVFRFTRDIDFLVYESDAEAIDNIMTSLDYERQDFSNDEIVSYLSQTAAFGQVDFMLARRKYTRAMMKNAKEMPIFEGELSLKTIRPEDLIGLKVQALVNDPENRSDIDEPDIRRLLRIHHETLDMKLVREYFRVFDKEDLLDGWLQKIK